MNNKDKISFFSQGSYGCVSYPAIKCNMKTQTKKNISKLVKNDFFSKNELNIGKLLNKIVKKENIEKANIFLFYNKYCKIQETKLKKDYKSFYEKCDLLDKKKIATNKSKYLVMYSKYIESKEIYVYLNDSITWTKIFLFYKFMLKSLHILIKYKIVHCDLSQKNILISNKETFHIIDFGLSFYYKKCFKKNKQLNMKYLKLLFIYYPKHIFWSFEYHLICFLLHENIIPDKNILRKLANELYLNNNIFNLLYKKELEHFINKSIDFYYNIINEYQNIETLIEVLINESYYTWDLYSLSLLCLTKIYKYNMENEEPSFILLLKQSIDYDFNKRPQIHEHIDRFYDILKY